MNNHLISVVILYSLLTVSSSVFASASIAEICDINGEEDSYTDLVSACRFTSELHSLLNTASTVEIYTKVINTCLNTYQLREAPLMLIEHPRLEVRQAGHLVQENLANQLVSELDTINPTNNYLNVIREAAKNPASYSPLVKTHFDELFKTGGSAMLDVAKVGYDHAGLICFYFGIIGCSSALREAIEISNSFGISGSGDIIAVEQFKEFMTNPKMSQGLAIAALRILKLKDDAQNGTLPKTHLLDDLIAGFESVGNDHEESIDLAFTFLSYYGTRGASMTSMQEFVVSETLPVQVSAMVIASAIGTLDQLTVQSHHPYSLPPEVSTNCNYGRPYHFWMNSVLARLLVKKNHSPLGAIVAAHIVSVGFEMFMISNTRDPWYALTLPGRSIENNGLRVNISFNDSGAKFGAQLATGSPISSNDLDEHTRILINHAGELPLMDSESGRNLFFKHVYKFSLRWLTVFKPNAGFRDLLWQ